MTTGIDVEVDPMAAFVAFTEEYDQWWGDGPIDADQSWRLVERRIEPGVGGRLVEDHGDEERVLGTITVWEPGARLAWTTRDDVTIEVTFAPHADGTRVTVTGLVPDGVDGTAQLSMLRMAPQWFPRHIARREAGRRRPHPGRLGLGLRSATPAATARWLADVFQLECTSDIPETEGDPLYTWIEFRIGNGLVVLWGGGGTIGTDTPIVFVDDLDAHLEHAGASGAEIITTITEHGYRSYTAKDCEGRHWQFAQPGPRIGE
ncbi:MAG: SRPBCC domain-containing protein [Acidimicrobiales bacterium]|nr:SRPBCC domain-containing protein [Acidimicrobiales bacterium]